MARTTFIGGGSGFVLEDVNGSFKRFLKNAPIEAKKRIAAQVLVTAHKLEQRMQSTAPVGPDSPHIARAVTFSQRGQTAKVGYLAEDFGGDPANDSEPQTWNGASVTNAMVAMFNEYGVSHKGSGKHPRPFMKNAAEAEQQPFVNRIKGAIESMEKALSSGGL